MTWYDSLCTWWQQLVSIKCIVSMISTCYIFTFFYFRNPARPTDKFCQILSIIFGRPFVKRFALCYWTVVCLSCPVCDVGVLWLNAWMDQVETWHGGRPRPQPQCIRWVLPPKGGTAAFQFSAHVLWSNGWMDHNATW